MSRLRLLYVFTILILAFPSVAMAKCQLLLGNPGVSLKFGKNLAGGLIVPADTPNGAVIYEETGPFIPQIKVICDASFTYGVLLNSALGSPSEGRIYPLGKTGLSFRIAFVRNGDNEYLQAATPYFPSGYYWTGDAVTLFQIIKTGAVSSQSTVPAGYLGKLIMGEHTVFSLDLINSISLKTASCESPGVAVQMGDDYRMMEFSNSGDAPRKIDFAISLDNCQSGINRVTYALKANSVVLNREAGIVALSSSSTAKGIGLQLMTGSGEPLTLDKTYPFGGFNTMDKNFKIPLSASFYRLANSKLIAGTANAEVTFIINYL